MTNHNATQTDDNNLPAIALRNHIFIFIYVARDTALRRNVVQTWRENFIKYTTRRRF